MAVISPNSWFTSAAVAEMGVLGMRLSAQAARLRARAAAMEVVRRVRMQGNFADREINGKGGPPGPPFVLPEYRAVLRVRRRDNGIGLEAAERAADRRGGAATRRGHGDRKVEAAGAGAAVAGGDGDTARHGVRNVE